MTPMYAMIIACVSGCEGLSKDFTMYPDSTNEFYFDKTKCEDDARSVAIGMHMRDGRDWGYKCVLETWEPKKIP